MELTGRTALVTGANRGIGSALAAALREAGAAKVYAAVRDPASVADPHLVAVGCDVTDAGSVAAAAAACPDVDLVVSNAGIAFGGSALRVPIDRARQEIETNYLGTLALAQAFAPVLAANGGGAFVSMLSVAAWRAAEHAATYGASKAAQWSLTNALRMSVRDQGTLVVGVHCGFVDTDLTKLVPGEKLAPEDVAAAIVRGLEARQEEVLVDDLSRRVKASLPRDLELLYGAP